jgi:hypothetical protein
MRRTLYSFISFSLLGILIFNTSSLNLGSCTECSLQQNESTIFEPRYSYGIVSSNETRCYQKRNESLLFTKPTTISDAESYHKTAINAGITTSDGPISAYVRRAERVSQRFGIEEEEAIILESICVGATGGLKSSIRFTASVIRRTGDTLSGLASVAVKSFGGILRLSADGIWLIAMRLAKPRAPDQRMPHALEYAGRRFAKVLRAFANVLYGLAEACILAGESTEAFTIGTALRYKKLCAAHK